MSRNYDSGIIVTEEARIYYYQKDFEFTFLSPQIYDSVGENQLFRLISDDNGFITGNNHDGNLVSIYVGHDLEFVTTCHFTTSCYIVGGNGSLEDYSEYDEISFVGGVVNLIHPPNACSFEYDQDIKKYIIDFKDNSIEYSFDDIDILSNLTVITHSVMRHSREEGSSVSNGDSEIIWESNSKLDLGDLFKAYDCLLTLCQFMVFRNNVCFSQIKLSENRMINGHEVPFNVAEVHIKAPDMITQKKSYNCLHFLD